ncbi:6321_t:CDS:2 [Acaulospora colombiana]|uniref:6321_t:CDS:1 n=1 Tax=Acaulospora colombiana TaxID=27376 RepID=A0ACA9LY32_9GLOM|nr:6321_t:CDS:2 [Acaulospora colombiana]
MTEKTDESKAEKLFPEIGEVADDDGAGPTEIESLCMSCGQNGITKLLLTKIPHWKEIVIMSFNCEHCGLSNNEVQFAGKIAENGCTYTCRIDNKEDLNRQLVKSETASIRIPELDLEIPATTKKGRLTTVEGLVSGIVEDLSADQPIRKSTDEETYNKIDAIIRKLSSYLEEGEEFSIVVDDPAGNR